MERRCAGAQNLSAGCLASAHLRLSHPSFSQALQGAHGQRQSCKRRAPPTPAPCQPVRHVTLPHTPFCTLLLGGQRGSWLGPYVFGQSCSGVLLPPGQPDSHLFVPRCPPQPQSGGTLPWPRADAPSSVQAPPSGTSSNGSGQPARAQSRRRGTPPTGISSSTLPAQAPLWPSRPPAPFWPAPPARPPPSAGIFQ